MRILFFLVVESWIVKGPIIHTSTACILYFSSELTCFYGYSFKFIM